MAEKQSWFQRRHDYGPSGIGLTEPEPVERVDTPTQYMPPPSAVQVDRYDTDRLINIIDNKIDKTNNLLEELINMQYHNQITDEDIDVSDSVTYNLGSSVAAIISYKVPDDYVLLLREFSTSLLDDTTYYVYLDNEMFQYVPDMEFPGMGLPIESGVTFKMYVLNTYGISQDYTTLISASLRRNINWKYSRRSYRIPV